MGLQLRRAPFGDTWRVDLLALGLILWSWWLSRRPQAPRWLKWVTPMLLLAYLSSTIGAVLVLKQIFAAVASAPPHEKAELLARGISAALYLPLAELAVDAAALIALTWVSMRMARRRTPSSASG